MNIEQKAEELRKRWDELHPPKKEEAPKPKPRIGYKLSFGVSNPTVRDPKLDRIDNDAAKSIFNQDMFNSLKLSPEDEEKMHRIATGGAKGPRNNDWMKLKEPIMWFHDIAVGERIGEEGRWDAIPKYGITISFYGPRAKEFAINMAMRMAKLE